MSTALVGDWLALGPQVTTRRGAIALAEVELGDRVACWSRGHLTWRSVTDIAPGPAQPVVRVEDAAPQRDPPSGLVAPAPVPDRANGAVGRAPLARAVATVADLDRGDPIVVVDGDAMAEAAAPVNAVGYRGVLGALPDPRFTAERVLAVQPAGLAALCELQLDGADNYIADGAVVAHAFGFAFNKVGLIDR